MSPRPRMAVVGARARMRPVRAQRSGSIGRTLAAASASCEIGLSSLFISPSHQASLRAEPRAGRSDPLPSVLGGSRKRQDGPFLMQASSAIVSPGAHPSAGQTNVANRRLAAFANRGPERLNWARKRTYRECAESGEAVRKRDFRDVVRQRPGSAVGFAGGLRFVSRGPQAALIAWMSGRTPRMAIIRFRL